MGAPRARAPPGRDGAGARALKTLITLIGTAGAQKMSGARIARAKRRAISSTCRCSSGSRASWSHLQPTITGTAHLVKERAFSCHLRIESRLSRRHRSNMSSTAAASLHTSGSIDSKCEPPMSHTLNVISCPCTLTVFSMKLTPCVGSCVSSNVPSTYRTMRLVLPTPLSPTSATFTNGGCGPVGCCAVEVLAMSVNVFFLALPRRNKPRRVGPRGGVGFGLTL